MRGWLEDAEAGKAAFDSKALNSALASREVALRGVETDLLLAAYVATPNAIPGTLDDQVFRRRESRWSRRCRMRRWRAG